MAHPVRVLILTTFDLDDYVYTALRNGAAGFVLKDTPPEDRVRAVRIVARGDALLAPTVTRRLIDEVAQLQPKPTPPPKLALLTDREREVLGLVASATGSRQWSSPTRPAWPSPAPDTYPPDRTGCPTGSPSRY